MATFDGGSSADTFTGGSGNDRADGNGGDDTLRGGAGYDDLAGNGGADTLVGGTEADVLYSGDRSPPFSLPYYDFEGTPPLLDTGSEVDRLSGGDGDDRLFAGYGDNVNGGAGANDYLFISFLGGASGVTADFRQTVQTIGGGIVRDVENISWVQGSNHADDINVGSYFNGGYSDFTVLYGMGGNDNLVAGYYTGTISGDDGDDVVDGRPSQYLQKVLGGAGNDTLYTNPNTFAEAFGGEGNDVIYSHGATYGGSGHDLIFVSGSYYSGAVRGEDGDDEIHASGFGNVLDGGRGADRIYGAGGVDQIDGASGNDWIVGGDGDDSLFGGKANDRVFGGSADDVVDGGDGRDRLYGGDGLDMLRGGAGDDRLFGGDGDDLLGFGIAVGYSDPGADYMEGGSGSDDYNIDDAGDLIVEGKDSGFDTAHVKIGYFVLPDEVENAFLTNSAGSQIFGNDLMNIISGDLGDDQLHGGGGNDYLTGGEELYGPSGGNDLFDGGEGIDEVSYSVASAAITVSLLTEGPQDTGGAGVDTLLGVESLTGSGFDDTLRGNSDVNVLDGGAGADRLVGGGGNDTYFVDNDGDVVREFARGGNDTIYTLLASYSLAGTAIENLIALGPVDNWLIGNAYANILNGGVGADRMEGGAGNDTYVVGNSGDQVVETSADHGVDLVKSSVSYVLGDHVENLVLTGAGAVNGTGNALVNVMTGNAAANVLDGGSGADTMKGGGGDDVYLVDHARDRVVEDSGGGRDTVESAIGYTLGANVERLTLVGSSATAGVGNGLDNVIVGNGASNKLNGKAGADLMLGGGGNDSYHVDDIGDRAVEESASGGIDTVYSSVAFRLGSYVENLVLTGSASVGGTGNARDNVINGNGAANSLAGAGGDDVLRGEAGADSLVGGAGMDALRGGSGADGFYFTAPLVAANVDRILDFSSGEDTIFLDRGEFVKIAGGTLAPNAFHIGTAAADAGDRIVYDPGTGKIFYDSDGAGGADAILFATVTRGTDLQAADFFVYG